MTKTDFLGQANVRLDSLPENVQSFVKHIMFGLHQGTEYPDPDKAFSFRVHGDGKSVIFNSMVDNDDAFFAQMRPNCQLRVTDLGLYWYGGSYDGYHFLFNDDYPPSVVAIIVVGRMCISEPFLPGNEDSKLQNQ